MTLEEVIANAEAQAIRDEKEAERIRKYGGKFYDDEVQACLICAEQHRQLAELLRELKERRKQSEIIHCKDCRWNDGVCYCEFHYRDVKPTDYCSWAERRTNDSV